VANCSPDTSITSNDMADAVEFPVPQQLLDEELHDAIKTGNTAAVADALQAGASVHAVLGE
jgi:hypothetical protein